MTRAEEIARNIEAIRAGLGGAQLCAVTKTRPVEDINAAIAAGILTVYRKLPSSFDGLIAWITIRKILILHRCSGR